MKNNPISRLFISILSVWCVALIFGTKSLSAQVIQPTDTGFNFVFMTDVHIADQPHILESYRKAMHTINKLNPDFVLSGGDQVYDVMRGDVKKSEALFELFLQESKKLHAPLYTTVGNHELFGIYKESPTDSTHQDYKYGMYERYLGKPYYSFDHKGWHFVVLNNLNAGGFRYFGGFSDEQIDWLRKDLEQVGTERPVVMMMHIPIVSVQNQYQKSKDAGSPGPDLENRSKIMDIIQEHQVKLVLQGHLHFFEDIQILGNTHFITGPAVAGRPSWRGTVNGPRGFLHFKILGDQIQYDFVAYDTP